MDSKLAEFDEELPLRPSLLTVLCILTFIGSGWTMISSIIAYSTAPQYVKMFTANTKRQREEISLNDSLSHKDSLTKKTAHKRDSAFGEKMMTSMSKIVTTDNIRKSAIGGIISALFTLFGALLMWRLKRNGFYIYIVGRCVTRDFQ